MRPLRILHLVANRWWTGSADPALALARSLMDRGHSVWFGCVLGDVLETHVREAGVPLVEAISLERTALPWRLAAQIGTVRRALKDLRIDVVHTHQTHDHWLAALARNCFIDALRKAQRTLQVVPLLPEDAPTISSAAGH